MGKVASNRPVQRLSCSGRLISSSSHFFTVASHRNMSSTSVIMLLGPCLTLGDGFAHPWAMDTFNYQNDNTIIPEGQRRRCSIKTAKTAALCYINHPWNENREKWSEKPWSSQWNVPPGNFVFDMYHPAKHYYKSSTPPSIIMCTIRPQKFRSRPFIAHTTRSKEQRPQRFYV